MNGSYQLRAPTASDANAMWRVRTAAIAAVQDYAPESVAKWANVAQPDSFAKSFEELETIVCIDVNHPDDPQLVGWGFAHLDFKNIAAMFVDPARQRSGIGRRIYLHFEELAKARNVKSLSLSASLNAVPFYEALGFVRTRDSMYRHPEGFDLPSVIMTKHLD